MIAAVPRPTGAGTSRAPGSRSIGAMSDTLDATELAFAGAARQADLIAAGTVSSRELTELYLERIDRLDGS